MSLDLESPEVQEAIQKAAQAKVDEVQLKFQQKLDEELASKDSILHNKEEILNEKKALAEKLKEVQSAFGDKDPAYVKSLIDQIENNEVMKMISEGKVEEAFEKKTEKLQAGYQAEVEKAKALADSEKGRAESLMGQVRQMKIDDAIKTAFMASDDAHPTGLVDATMRANSIFSVDEDGTVAARDKNGMLLTGKNGALTPSEWVDTVLREDAPHLFKTPVGIKSNGSGGFTSASNKLWANMSFQEKRQIMDADPAKAAEMSKASIQ